ncbi:hypothetical protein BDV26DRAFT_259198 [Aspergillus bertholletiae]|uniref:Uncharacterized protein n=1 Tax=Aspergillus bertholletiae TaxID=1226010 RepID=A0A5N7BCI3_9EURO|nr:hypothetical protein BDV26DRAFT_259198 [Aspergillus bertholletiae]
MPTHEYYSPSEKRSHRPGRVNIRPCYAFQKRLNKTCPEFRSQSKRGSIPEPD